MGMEQRVHFTSEAIPSWYQVRGVLTTHNLAVQLRMIDGELAFPDEEPAESWRELRVSGPGGMVSLRREPTQVVLVVWGNAGPELHRFWNALAWACAEAGQGQIETPTGLLSPAAYRQTMEFPPEFSV